MPFTNPQYWSISLLIVRIGIIDMTRPFAIPSFLHQIASMIKIYEAQYKPSGRLNRTNSGILQSYTECRIVSTTFDNPNAEHHLYMLRDLLRNKRYIKHPHISITIHKTSLSVIITFLYRIFCILFYSLIQ